jgi:hypothetical protein
VDLNLWRVSCPCCSLAGNKQQVIYGTFKSPRVFGHKSSVRRVDHRRRRGPNSHHWADPLRASLLDPGPDAEYVCTGANQVCWNQAILRRGKPITQTIMTIDIRSPVHDFRPTRQSPKTSGSLFVISGSLYMYPPCVQRRTFRCRRPSLFNYEDPWLLHVPSSAEWSSRITSDLHVVAEENTALTPRNSVRVAVAHHRNNPMFL